MFLPSGWLFFCYSLNFFTTNNRLVEVASYQEFFGAFWYLYLLCVWVELNHCRGACQKILEFGVYLFTLNKLSSLVHGLLTNTVKNLGSIFGHPYRFSSNKILLGTTQRGVSKKSLLWKLLSPSMHNVPKWADTLQWSCQTILGYVLTLLWRRSVSFRNWLLYERDLCHERVQELTLLWRRSLSYRNQSIDLPSKSMDWFLYDNGLRHERVKRSDIF